jgi:excisionase family DNA binding protein
VASPAPVPLTAPAQPNRVTRRHPPKQIQRGYIGITEAAIYLDVAPKTIRKLIADGKLPAYRLGRRVLKVRLADLDGVLTPIPNGAVLPKAGAV